MMTFTADKYTDLLENLNPATYIGTVSRVVGLTIESIGPQVNIGETCRIYKQGTTSWVDAEWSDSGKTRLS